MSLAPAKALSPNSLTSLLPRAAEADTGQSHRERKLASADLGVRITGQGGRATGKAEAAPAMGLPTVVVALHRHHVVTLYRAQLRGLPLPGPRLTPRAQTVSVSLKGSCTDPALKSNLHWTLTH